MYYRHPAGNNLPENTKKSSSKSFFQESLPLGNGHLGVMFNGGISTDLIMINDISAWMNTVRGENEVSQSGVQIGSYRNFEKVREATRNGCYGIGENSIEALGTKYISSKMPLGNYAPFTNLYITTDHDSVNVKNYIRGLDLRRGIGFVNYEIKDKKYSREYFCSFENDVFVIKYTCNSNSLNLKIKTRSQHKNKIEISGNEIVLTGETSMKKNNMHFQQRIHVFTDEGKVFPYDNEVLNVEDARNVYIVLSAYTDYLPVYPHFSGRDYVKDSKRAIEKALSLGYERLKDSHIKDISTIIDRCKLNLDYNPSHLPTDSLINNGSSRELDLLYFNYSRYLQTACSRGTAVPSNLQGIWNPYINPMWNCDYHNDINIAMNYWMVETSNLQELFMPYFGWMKIIAKSGRYSAQESFGINNGWSSGLNSNIFGFSAQNEHGRRMQHSGAWLCQNLYEHYSFTQDKEYLKEIYPIIKGAAEFYLDFLAPWKDGTLVVYPTWSPENAFLPEKYGNLNKQSYGASYDQQLIYNLFVDCLEASFILNKDEDFRERIKNIIPKLCPQKIGHFGQIQEWPEDLDRPDDTHRHLSHLIALFPGRDFSLYIDEKLYNAAETTMNHRDSGDNDDGWKAAIRMSLWARLFDGNAAYRFYSSLTTKSVSQNLFNGGKSVFQIDGNFGAGAGVCEMLLQSHLRSVDNVTNNIYQATYKGYRMKDSGTKKEFVPVVPNDVLYTSPYILHLLPALPDAWKDGEVKGLKARGNFTVDIKWKDKKISEAKISANTGGSFRILNDGILSDVITLQKGNYIILNESNFKRPIQ